MPIFSKNPLNYKKSRDVVIEWSNFRKGLNLILRPTELGHDELAQADNIVLTGSGVPTGRWGTATYFTANATGSNRGFGTYKSSSANELLTLTDQGYIVKKNGTSSTTITGQSYPSGSVIRAEQLGGKTYFVSKDVSFTQYNGTNLTPFATISSPTGVYATNYSGATGSASQSYKVVAIGINGGQTTAGTNYVLTSLPDDLTTTQVHLFWSAPSAATFSGFEIYRGQAGDETWLAGVGPTQLKYVDNGAPASATIQAPLTNTTGGIKSSFIVKYKDRLLFVDKDDPTKLVITGRYPNHTKTNWLDGGGYIYIDPESGEDITGIAVQPIADRIVVYKESSSYLVELQLVQIGNYTVLDPQYQPISTAVGCASHDTIQTVENDTFYFGRNGLYVTGYEPNFLNIIRTNEISAKIRPYLATLSNSDYETANAMYVNNKYILSFPLKKEMIVYDRERGSFVGPWRTPFGVSHMKKYLDGDGTENWVLGSYENNQVYTFDVASNSDNGEIIIKTLRTNKDYFGDFTQLNILKFFYTLFRNVVGSITVNILAESRLGTTSTIKSFTITGSEVAGSTGWGTDLFGEAKWGQSNNFSAVTGGDEITRWGSLFKQARLVQFEVVSDANNSNFELLQLKINANKQSTGSLSSTQRV